MKKTLVPIICICNDRMKDSVRSLAEHCLDIKFGPPEPAKVVKVRGWNGRGCFPAMCIVRAVPLADGHGRRGGRAFPGTGDGPVGLVSGGRIGCRVQVDQGTIAGLVSSTNGDIRQILNTLMLWRVGAAPADKPVLTATDMRHTEKDEILRLSTFDAVRVCVK